MRRARTRTMPQFIDRRLKSARQEPRATACVSCNRTRAQIKEAVDKAVRERNDRRRRQGRVGFDPDRRHQRAAIPPLEHRRRPERVLPGNKEFVAGDRIDKPKGGPGRRAARARGRRRRGRLLLRADGGRIPRHPVRRSRTARPRQGLAEGRQSRPSTARAGYSNDGTTSQPQRAAHDAAQHEPTSGVAAADRRTRSGGLRPNCRVGRTARNLRRTEASAKLLARHRAAQNACSARSPSSTRSTCATTGSRA